MWIAVRLFITIASFFYKLLIRNTPNEFPMTHHGVPYNLKISSSSKRRSVTHLETPVASNFICSLSEETFFDRWAKKIGFGDEIQVDDADFNSRVFILGDHPLTAQYLSSSKELRDRIRALIPKQVQTIAITGETLRFVLQPEVDGTSLLDDLVFMRSGVEEIQLHARSRFADPYYTRAVILESVIVAVLTYGMITFAEMRMFHEDYHLNPSSLTRAGVIAALGVAAVVVALTWALLGKSSRAIRLMVENALLLMLTVPFVGFEIISDLNRGLDQSEPILVNAQIVEKYTQTHGSRRRRYTTYHLKIAPRTAGLNLPFKMPHRLSITPELYRAVEPGKEIDCEISLGYLGFPWYRSVEPHARAW